MQQACGKHPKCQAIILLFLITTPQDTLSKDRSPSDDLLSTLEAAARYMQQELTHAREQRLREDAATAAEQAVKVRCSVACWMPTCCIEHVSLWKRAIGNGTG
jgi:hypothetical protein